jgi:hypothetical protein
MIDFGQHRVVPLGSLEPFFVRLREPFSNVALTYPEITFTPFGGPSTDSSMTRLFEPVTVTAASGSTLTLSAALTTAVGLSYDLGFAWLRTVRDGARLVKIVRVAGSTVHLADLLTSTVDVTGGATLESAIWYVTLTSSETGALTQTPTGNRPTTWSVAWSAQPGASAPARPQLAAGTLTVVRRVFDTGLDTSALVADYPELSRATPPGQSDLAPQIRAALAEVGMAVRQHVLGLPQLRGFGSEHDADGSMLVAAHAALACSRVVGISNPARASLLAEEARRLLKSGLACLWVDLNRDGMVDGEEGQTMVSTTQASQIGRQLVAEATGRRFTLGARR